MRNWVLGIGMAACCISAHAAINITCSSERGGREYCQADASSGVQMLRQISSAVCRKGYSWDKDASGIWVDHGCKADFSISELGMLGSLVDRGKDYTEVHTFQCVSNDKKKRQFCQADTRGGLRVIKTFSSEPCIYGKSWGYDAGGVWVERFCKAEFEAGGGSSYKPPEVSGTGHVWGAGNGLKSVECSSADGAKHYCEANTSEGAVLVKDLGPSPACVRDETWGFDKRGVWVIKGCRGLFDTVSRETILQ
jgi:Protein of unknown function (DUF3011)